jgi:hypothetical protein
MMVTGEIDFGDGTKMLIPVRSPGDWQTVCYPSMLSDSYVISQAIPQPEQLGIDTLEGGLSWTGVMDAIEKAPESHAKGRADRTPVPVRYVVMVFLGLVLMGIGLAREPIALILWGIR